MRVFCIFRVMQYEGNTFVTLLEMWRNRHKAEDRVAELNEEAEFERFYTLEEWETEDG